MNSDSSWKWVSPVMHLSSHKHTNTTSTNKSWESVWSLSCLVRIKVKGVKTEPGHPKWLLFYHTARQMHVNAKGSPFTHVMLFPVHQIQLPYILCWHLQASQRSPWNHLWRHAEFKGCWSSASNAGHPLDWYNSHLLNHHLYSVYTS